MLENISQLEKESDYAVRGPSGIFQVLLYFVYQVEDLRTASFQDGHGSPLKFYNDALLDTEAVMGHVFLRDRLPVQRLFKLVEDQDKLLDQVPWKGLEKVDNTLKTISQI